MPQIRLITHFLLAAGLSFVLLPATAFSQVDQDQSASNSIEEPIDSMGFVLLEPITITPNPYAGMDLEARIEYRRLRRNVSKVYPYANKALALMIELEEVSEDMSKREKKKYRKGLERELKEEFKGELKKLTRSQGKLLIDMIERHCGQDFYTILQDLKNPTTAFFWQSFGKRYGYDLKEGYNPANNEQLELLLSSYRWPDKHPTIQSKKEKKATRKAFKRQKRSR